MFKTYQAVKEYKRPTGVYPWAWEIITIYSDGRVQSGYSQSEPDLPNIDDQPAAQIANLCR